MTMTTTTTCLLLLLSGVNSLPFRFNYKMCVDFPPNGDPNYWMLPFSGDYEWIGYVNDKPSYILPTCKDADNCHNDMILSISTNNQWYFDGQPSDGFSAAPFCNVATNAPSDACDEWWGPGKNDAQPIITECGATVIIPRLIATDSVPIAAVRSLRTLRTLPFSFNDKMCVDWNMYSLLAPYSGDYVFSGHEVNGKPLYILRTCRYPENCHNDMGLSIGGDGKWIFSRGPYCRVATNAPSDACDEWSNYNDGDTVIDQPTITECGDTVFIPRR